MSQALDGCMVADENGDEFVTWLVQILGPVLIGIKPAELISFPKYDSELPIKLNKIEEYIGRCHKISFKVFTYKKTSVKVLFYNPRSLDNYLRKNNNLKFLKSLEYPVKYSLDIYLEFLINKIKDGNIPDEIGVFLGYPLKDIIGFMGHPSLKLTKVNGWRVYGDPRVSDKKYKEILDAKDRIRDLLQLHTAERVLFSIQS